MKKIIAASLLAIYLFSVGGQLVMHQYFAYLSERYFNQQVSKGFYNINDLTEVALPVNMPNIADWAAYENVSGQIQFGDVSYNYVKMKITRHTLYLMCVPNYDATRLSNQNIINAKQAKSTHIPKKDHTPFSKTILLDNLNAAFNRFAFHSFFKTIQTQNTQPTQRLTYRFLTIPDQPPRLSC